MAISNHFLITGLGAPEPPLVDATAASGFSALDATLPGDNSYLSITFAGQTRTYLATNRCRSIQRNSTRFWYLNLGINPRYYLSVAVCGTGKEGFCLNYQPEQQADFGLLTYSCDTTVYSSYCCRLSQAGTYALTGGNVLIERSNCDRLVKGTFQGTLVSIDESPGPDVVQPISGHFHLYR